MTATPHYNTVVVGSGLAGLTAALRLSESGVSVALVEKTASLGGNSIKASSGINGVPTKYQDRDEGDSTDSFVSDTTLSGKGLCNSRLVDILAAESAGAISWLAEEIGVDLSVVSRLGGHSHARTHRGSGKLPPGFAIVSALTKKLKEAPNVEIMTSARLQRFVKRAGCVTGVVVCRTDAAGHTGEHALAADHVILATGGFCADTAGAGSLICKYRPDLASLPSTNGQQTTGDGQKLALAELNARLVHMDQVQVHPTGFVQLKDAASSGSKWKFLCGELVRGIGGVLLSPASGERFVNELDTRDHVTAAISHSCNTSPATPPVAVIIVGEKDYQKASAHIDFYVSQKLMFRGGAGDVCRKLAEIDPKWTVGGMEHAFEKALHEYNSVLATGRDPLGRTHFGSPIKSAFYFGFVTPVLHFTMGGVETNEHSQIVEEGGTVIPNVYAIGELSAGVHGGNRLGGSSLLECVVFGTRVARGIAGKAGQKASPGSTEEVRYF